MTAAGRIAYLSARHGGWSPRLTATFAELGVDATRVDDREVELQPGTVLLIPATTLWYPRTERLLLEAPPEARPTVVLWHSERLPPPAASGLPRPRLSGRELAKIALRRRRRLDLYSNAARLRRLAEAGLPDVLVVTSYGSHEYLQEAGLPAEVVHLGWHPELGTDLGLERDVDVLFAGAVEVPRRRRALRRLRRAGVRVEVATWRGRQYWGEERSRLLSRTRVLLNVSRFHGHYAGERLLLGAAHGAVVVSDPIYRPEPWVPGEHYVSASLDELPEVVRHYLGHEEERREIARRAHEFVAMELTFDRSLRRVLDLAEDRLAGGR